MAYLRSDTKEKDEFRQLFMKKYKHLITNQYLLYKI